MPNVNKEKLTKSNQHFEQLKRSLEEILPTGENYQLVVKPDQQNNKLEALNNSISSDTFYFVFNLLTCELENVNGVSKALGYVNEEFTVSQYLKSIHPGQAIQFNILSLSMYKVLCKGSFKLHFASQRYISMLALRHYNGEYLVFKKVTSVFQYDEKNRLLAQLNEFSLIGTYENTPLKPVITETVGLQKDDFEALIFKMTFEHFTERHFFSKNESQVLKHYSIKETLTNQQVADLMNVKITTINTYNTRILEKARDIFTHPFNNAREVAIYLKKEKII